MCSILRLSFDVRSQLSTDKVYGCWRAVAWIFPEMAFGIVVACAPVSAKFFQGMKETKAFLKARSSLSMLFSLFPSTSRGASSGNSAKDHIAMDGPALPTSALKPGQNKKFYNSSRRESNSSKSNPLTTVFGEDTPYQPGTYIMRTVNIETRFDSKNCRPSHSTEGEQNLWEAEGSHCTEVGV